jgi:hypothetical protein
MKTTLYAVEYVQKQLLHGSLGIKGAGVGQVGGLRYTYMYYYTEVVFLKGQL